MGQSGKFNKTVDVQEPIRGENDSFGHSVTQYESRFKCAARVWTLSSVEQSFNPADFGASTLKLLLRLQARKKLLSWGVTYEGSNYVISATEQRDDDLLVTLQAR